MQESARIIMAYLIQSGRESPEALMKKINEESMMCLSTRPIIAFVNGSHNFSFMSVHLKNYYRRHPGVLLVSDFPLNVTYQEKKPWYYPVVSLFSFSSSSKKTSQSSRSSESLSDDFDKTKKKD